MALEQLRPSETTPEWPTLPRPSQSLGRAARRFGALAESWWPLDQPVLDRRTPAEWRAVADRFQAVTARLCAESGVTIDVRGARPPAGSLIVANHLGEVDSLVLPAQLPCTCIAAPEAADQFVAGLLSQRLGVSFVERGSAASGAVALRQALRALDAGVAVVAFVDRSSLAAFPRGAVALARRMSVPVVAAALAREAGRVRLSFSAPIDPHAWPDAAALGDAARDFITARLAEDGQANDATTR